MSLEQAKLSISNGAEVADDLAKRGAHLVAGGDMGIGNTSSAAAICAAMTGTDPARVTGRGARALTTRTWYGRSPSFAAASNCTSPTRLIRSVSCRRSAASKSGSLPD